MILVQITAGLVSLFGPRVQFWVELSLCLLFTLAIVLLTVAERKEHIKRKLAKALMASTVEDTPLITPGMKSAAIQASKYLGCFLLGAAIAGPLAWLWREHEFNVNRYTYYGVLVVERYSATSFLIYPAGMEKAHQVDFDVAQDFERGQKMNFSFEQRIGYKHLLWASFCPQFCDAHGKRIIYDREIANGGY